MDAPHSFAPGPAAGRNTVYGAAPNTLGGFAHWLLGTKYGLGAVPGQLLHMFNPSTKAGWANILGSFAGGGKFDASPQMGELGMPGQFVPYGADTGTALDRGVTNEGPLRPGKGYNPSMQKMVERAHTNPFIRASSKSAAAEWQNAMEHQSALDMARQRAAQAMQARRQIDEHLGSAPMHDAGYMHPDHGAGYLHAPSEIAHPNFLRSMLRRKYGPGIQPNHN